MQALNISDFCLLILMENFISKLLFKHLIYYINYLIVCYFRDSKGGEIVKRRYWLIIITIPL